MEMRAITVADLPLLQKWIDRDPQHAGCTAKTFLDAPDQVMFCDELGEVMAVRFAPEMILELEALRVGVQFDSYQPRRNAPILLKAFHIVRDKAVDDGFDVIIFESQSEQLIDFCVKRLGFVRNGDQLAFVLKREAA